MKNKIINTMLSFVLPILFLIIWQFLAVKLDSPLILPTLDKVVSILANPFDSYIGLGSIPKNIAFSVIRVIIGYFGGVIFALPLGLLVGYYSLASKLLENFVSIFRTIPSLAWQPLILGWFGITSIATVFLIPYGDSFAFWDNFKISMIFLIALGAFFPTFGITVFGVRNVRSTLVESARVLGAREIDIFFHVLLPAASPQIINGLKMSLSTSWVCLVCAEMLPGSMAGLGYLITHAYELARTDLVVVGMVCIGGIGALFDGVFRLILRKYFSWESKVK